LDFEAEGLRDETFSPREKSVQRLFGEDDIFEKDKESGLM